MNSDRNTFGRRHDLIDHKPLISGAFMEDKLSSINDNAYDTAAMKEQAKVIDLIQQRDEALKREVAAVDRLKLQEALHTKQVMELKAQIRKLTVENQKGHKGPSSVASFNNNKTDKKKDGKSREVRELIKTVDFLKNENEELQKKSNKLSQFIQNASRIQQQSISDCQQKDEMILNLRRESMIAQQVKLDETSRRYQAEAELESIHTYLDYTIRKKQERLRNKSVQTMLSVPVQQRVSAIRRKAFNPVHGWHTFTKQDDKKEVKSNVGTSYPAIKSAASLWQTKLMEYQFQQQSKEMEKRFYSSVFFSEESPQKCFSGTKSKTLFSLPGSRAKPQVNSFSIERVDLEKLARMSRNQSDVNLFDLTDSEIVPAQLHSSHVIENEESKKSKTVLLPPPPSPPALTNGNKSSHKFLQHSTAFVPGAVVYNSRK